MGFDEGWFDVAVFLGVVWLALSALTAAGSRRRGQGLALATVAGVFFPATWAAWYLVDHHQGGPRTTRRAP